MNQDLIIELLHRVLEEKTIDIREIRERISVLNHQIQHFKGMNIRYQREVIVELIKDINSYDVQGITNWKPSLECLMNQLRGEEEVN